jgi:hypothetical protein
MRNETAQRQGPFERDSWHSVGHLHTGHEIQGENDKVGANDELPSTSTRSAW